jgi:hypothetical protein
MMPRLRLVPISEFNTLGQLARKFHADAFTWMHPSDVPPVCKQYWSWGGLTDNIHDEINKLIT